MLTSIPLLTSLTLLASSEESPVWVNFVVFAVFIGGICLIKWLNSKYGEQDEEYEEEEEEDENEEKGATSSPAPIKPVRSKPVPPVTLKRVRTLQPPPVQEEAYPLHDVADQAQASIHTVHGAAEKAQERLNTLANAEAQAQASILAVRGAEEKAQESINSRVATKVQTPLKKQSQTNAKPTPSMQHPAYSSLQSALIWKEILDQPVALRHTSNR